MLERSSKSTPQDSNELAAYVVKVATKYSDEKNPNAVALGRLGGKKGGVARAKKLTPERRREIAQKAANTRWLSI
jgi:hypothetical protein